MNTVTTEAGTRVHHRDRDDPSPLAKPATGACCAHD